LQDTSAETVRGNRIEFRILGPLEVCVDDAPLRIGGPRQRALLAFLLLSANEVVSRDRLVEELFGEARPESADHTLRVQVSRLRKALGVSSEHRLVASPPGYRLRVELGELDLHVFEQLLGAGRRALEESDAGRAVAELRAAEKLWRGRPLADLEFEPFARLEVERLEELRLAAVETRIEAELALGREAALVPELEALVGEHPLREGLRSQLMLALYRSGRQADALETYRAGRSLLSRELALEPSPGLRELEQAILRQEPALELAAEPHAVATEVLSASPRAPHRDGGTHGTPAPRPLQRYVVSGTLAVAALLAATAFIAPRFTSGAPTLQAAANSVGIIDPRGGTIQTVVDTGGQPRGIAWGAGVAWVTDAANDLLLRIDRKGAVERIPVGNGPTGVAVADGAVWVVNQLDRTVFELNPRAFRRVATFRVGNGADAVAFGHGSLWVANTSDGTISRIDPATGTAATIPLAGTPSGLAVGREGVWVTTSAGQLVLVDAAGNGVTRAISIGNGPAAVAVGAGSVWVTNTPEATVSRFNPGSGTVTKIMVGGAPRGIAHGSGAIWVADGRDGMVDRIDPNGNAVRSIRVGNEPATVAAGSGRVWTTVLPAPNAHRGGTLRVAESPAFSSLGGSVDPAVFAGVGQWQMLSITNDGLVTYRRIGGIAGDTLVPDLATELPSPTGAGRIYTFHLRSGIRYSDGTRVRPEDFRHAIERVFKVGSGYTQSPYTGIVGAKQCERTPRRCTLRRGIVTDDRGDTITFRLTAPDPDFLYKLAFPMADAVPANAPSRDIGRRPLPATGPYMTESVVLLPRPLDREHGRGIRNWTLVRNPRFHEWSADAQPSGYPDRIVLNANTEAAQAAFAIAHGVDVLLSPMTRELPELERHYATQLHSNPNAATFGFVMNTRVAPFDRLAVRRALNYAIDRKRILALAGGSFEAQSTCQILPPTLAGYRPYCPYTLQANASGTWIAPDLAKAERLVRASGTRNARVTVLVPPPDPMFPTTKIGGYIVSVLRVLGFRASLRMLSSPAFDRHLGDSRAQPQIGWFSWYQDYPAPSNFIEPLLTCGSFIPSDPANLNIAEFCDPKIDTESRRAAALEAQSPGISAEEWRKIDRQLTNRATWLPLYNPRVPVALSERVGNYQYHPFWQLLLDQLWVR
jgi:ABC-type transport system substrate-binding protein/DNA-binding SARP family transcriptional activator/streptogramin lyase